MPTTHRKRLTPHQAEVLDRIIRHARTTYGARSQNIGCRAACQHLEEKGFIVAEEVIGPRGGTTWRYRPA